MSKLQTVQNVEGLVLKFYTNSDLTGIAAARVNVTKPSGATATWTLDVSDTTSDDPNYAHMLTYTTASGDLDEAGNYVLELWVDLGTFKGYADEPIWLDVRPTGKV